MSRLRRPSKGARMTRPDIAKRFGVTPECVRLWETRALVKLHERLKSDPVLREMWETPRKGGIA